MEEVDNIILQNLSSLGWESDSEAKCIKDLSNSDIANGIVKCLVSISEELNIPHSLPHNMAQRFRVAATLADAIKDLGYKDDIGYQSILYPSEVELRKLFMFLIERLPKDSPVLQKEPLGWKGQLHANARLKIKSALKRPWVPPHCLLAARKKKFSTADISLTQYGTLHSMPYNPTSYPYLDIYSESEDNSPVALEVPSLVSHVGLENLYPTLLNIHAEQLNALELSSEMKEHGSISSGFSEIIKNKESLHINPLSERVLKYLSASRKFHATSQQLPFQEVMQDAISESRDNEVNVDVKKEEYLLETKDILQKEIIQLADKLQELSSDIQQEDSLTAEYEEELKDTEESHTQERKHLELLQKTAMLTENPIENIEELKANLNFCKAKEEKLLNQWLKYKKPLENELDDLTNQLSETKSKKDDMLLEISRIRDKMKHLELEATKKQSLLVHLQQQEQTINKGVHRSVYTKRIFDISSKVRKQKEEIDRVISDIRTIQKEINNLTGKLERTFAVVEDSSYRAASSNEKARPVYRTVISIHEMCGELVDIVRDTGAMQREVSDIQQQLDVEKNKKVEVVLQQLEEDLSRLKMENSVLKKKFTESQS